MTAIVSLAAERPEPGRAVARACALAWDAVREAAFPWAAGALLLGPRRWWAEGFVLAHRAAEGVGPIVERWRARATGTPGASDGGPTSPGGPTPPGRPTSGEDVRSDARSAPRRRSGARRRRVLRRAFAGLVWTVVVTFAGAFAVSVAVPAWYGLQGRQLLIVTSGSMSPFVEAGDVAVLQTIDDPSQLQVGQVVTFWPPGSKHLVTHRVVDLQMLPVLEEAPGGRMVPRLGPDGQPILRPYVYTKGDANRTRDPNATPLSLVRGVVVGSHPGWGRWLAWAQSPTGRLTMLAPPLLLLGALELVEVAAERRRRPVLQPAPRREVPDVLDAV